VPVGQVHCFHLVILMLSKGTRILIPDQEKEPLRIFVL